MIDPIAWVEAGQAEGATLWTGVPCSYLKSLIDCVISHPQLDYVPAANEGDAVAIAAGAWLGGGLGVALMQNSGLGNAVNPLTSLLEPFAIPMLLLVTWRGQPGGPADEPQHELMGQITPGLLDLMQIPYEILPADEQAALDCLRRQLRRTRAERRCHALVIPSGRFASHPPTPALEIKPLTGVVPAPTPARLSRSQMLQGLLEIWGPGDLVVATTGYTGRELYALNDRDQHLYLVGSMGCASSLGLGLALRRPEKRIWVLDGDGALLMRMGALSSLGWVRPDNLVHVLLDNGVHESTGAQSTVSASLDFCEIARGCGYPHILRWSRPEPLEIAGLTFIHAPILPGIAAALPRPKQKPRQVADRFRGVQGL
ncbi:MAG: phosphonopyruvate decarboxylase [Candidatus Eremiobacteraeota bacterium]|nr:phosphonopyruvate decarboxylase [Candidatus Eremiobacteraeota bacterium]MCW5869840.1 phosphonopyruvate decarboxylase [Candidatus Eremiobacteraeota bacterium]